MKYNFYIEKIKFDFEIVGTGKISMYWNGQSVDNFTVDTNIKESNRVNICFTKSDPADVKSYAILKSVIINGYDFTEDFKGLEYSIDPEKHGPHSKIHNNLYFGYIGQLNFTLDTKTDLLSKAAWIIADKEFRYIKFPTKNLTILRKEKNKEIVMSDARDCFFGFGNVDDAEMIEFVNDQKISALNTPLVRSDTQINLQKFINQSKRINFTNFEAVPNFAFTDGIIESINSFVGRSQELYIPTKAFYIYREILGERNIKLKDIFKDPLVQGSKVLLELPSPWYSTDLIIETIKKAKEKECTVALDLTWMPITNDIIDLDLAYVDEIYFGMNKTWPVTSLRPAFRWSRKNINDVVSFKWTHCTYSITSANVFMRLTEKYGIDYIYDKYLPVVDKINTVFGLGKTSVLWFNSRDDIKHNEQNYISPHFFHDELVGMKQLIKHHGKYFW